MKKNLFGAVSAALALALAITSFGCESGNDNPVRAWTDADRAALDKAVFKYVANPTNYTAANLDTATLFDGDATGGYSLKTGMNALYINGVQAYSLADGKFGVENVKKDGKPGTVYNTTNENVALNAADNTFEYTTDKTAYSVTGLEAAASATKTYNYALGATTVDAAYLNTLVTDVATKTDAVTAATVDWKKAGEPASGSEKTALDNANTALTAAKKLEEAARMYVIFGATKYIEETKTVAGVMTGTRTYYKDDKVVGDPVKLSGGSASSTKGVYKINDTNYMTSKFLLTTVGDNVFFDDDPSNYYTVKGVRQVNKIETDFPEATSEYSKKGRTVSITGGNLKADVIDSKSILGIGYASADDFTNNKRTAYTYVLQNPNSLK